MEEGATIWTNDKCISSSKEVRAAELVHFLQDDKINAIIPPWGGEFLMEILPLLNWDELGQLPPKWVLGYSDISTFTFAYTLITGIATANGINYIDLGVSELDELSKRWIDVLGVREGEEVIQQSSIKFQSSCDLRKLDTYTVWKLLNPSHIKEEVSFTGRLLGGCMDTISVLMGTPYAPVEDFIRDYCSETGVVWYLESCEMNAAEIYRRLWQMKQCGWFAQTNGVLIGRPAGYSAMKNFELVDALTLIFQDLAIPVIYDVDVGHVPPQITLVNGALAKVDYANHKGVISMTYV